MLLGGERGRLQYNAKPAGSATRPQMKKMDRHADEWTFPGPKIFWFPRPYHVVCSMYEVQ